MFFAKSLSVLILLAIIVATGFQLIRFAHITEGLEVPDHEPAPAPDFNSIYFDDASQISRLQVTTRRPGNL